MKYIYLLYHPEAQEPAKDSPEFAALVERYQAFGKEVTDKGVFVAGEPLEPSSTASMVAVREGKTQVTDGPYAETKEQLAGFYILDCKDLASTNSGRKLPLPGVDGYENEWEPTRPERLPPVPLRDKRGSITVSLK